MRYIGNKENLLDKIYQEMIKKKVRGESFFDFFAGTTSVSRYFKRLGYQIFSSDLLHFSYVLQRAYIVNNKELSFNEVLNFINFKSNNLFARPLDIIIEYLNQIEPKEGFIYRNYTPGGTFKLEIPRMYFSDENGQIIDAIRQEIEDWKINNLLNDDEYYFLVGCLIETVPFYANIAGVYAAFHKKWDPRAIKRLILRPIEFVVNERENFAFNLNSIELIEKIDADIYYLDPPYNQRQYAPNYHILETISKYDNPVIKGVSGLRDYAEQKSSFCNSTSALNELSKIASKAQFKTLILSYNTEGIMPQEQIITTLKQFGKVELAEFEYPRFKSNNNGESSEKKYIHEQLYFLNK